MTKKSIKLNYIYNLLYQILAIILPLITVPYISRVLGADGIGTYSYTYSIVYYFMIIALLGINNYGNRSIAKTRDDKKKMSKTFLGIYAIQLFMSMLMIVCYVGYVILFDNQYKMIAFIEILFILSAMVDVNWFFFGLEEFKITVVRNTILRLLTLALIFIFVRTKDDLWIYTLIMAGSTLLCNLILVPPLLKRIDFEKIMFKDIKKHIKPCLVLFIPVISVSLYKMMDKVMLGMLTNVTQVGYYEQAEKIANLPIALISALGTVMLPRISNLASKNENSKILEYIEKSVQVMMFLALPITFGLIGVAGNFVPIFLGNDFLASVPVLRMLSVTILFVTFASIIRMEYLLPKEKDRTYIESVIGGAIVNLIMNWIFIPKFDAIGACIGTICAEAFVMIYQIVAVGKELPIKQYLIDIISFVIKSFIMFIVVLLVDLLHIPQGVRLVVQTLSGIGTYYVLNVKYINSLIDFSKIPGKIKKKF